MWKSLSLCLWSLYLIYVLDFIFLRGNVLDVEWKKIIILFIHIYRVTPWQLVYLIVATFNNYNHMLFSYIKSRIGLSIGQSKNDSFDSVWISHTRLTTYSINSWFYYEQSKDFILKDSSSALMSYLN